MRRSVVLQWSAKYFRATQKTPREVAKRSAVGSVDASTGKSWHQTERATAAPHTMRRVAHSPRYRDTVHQQVHVATKQRRGAEPRQSHSPASMAHRSAVQMVRKALADIGGGRPSAKIIFEVKSEIMPALKLILPDPIQRQGNMEELLLDARQDKDGPSPRPSRRGGEAMHRFVAVPTSRIPQLANASDADVSTFLTNTALLRTPVKPETEESRSETNTKDEGTVSASGSVFAMDDIADMLQLAAQCSVFDANLILRLTSEVDRFVMQRAKEIAARNEHASSESPAGVEGSSRTTSSNQAPMHAPIMSPLAISNILFFVSQLGFLEEHILTELIRFDVLKNLQRRSMNPRQLLFVAVALCRFHCTTEDVFEKVMRAIARLCEGTTLREAPDASTAASSDANSAPPPLSPGFVLKSVVPQTSFAHPTYAVSADVVVEFTKCVSLSSHRTSGIVDSIAHRLLQLCEGGGSSAPNAGQLQFVCRLMQRMHLQCPPLDAALLVRAACEGGGAGVVLDHGGETEHEERGTYNEFSADFVKM